MSKLPKQHFDCSALVAAVRQQPIGLRISTNHPEGFRRVLYLHLRKQGGGGPRLHILQCPKSHNAFLLVRADFQLRESAV